MESALGYSRFTLGLIAGAFSFSYAIGQFVNGQLADNVGAKKLIFIGVVLSTIMNLLFGYVDVIILLAIIWSLNGYAQSTGWPSAVKIIRNWFGSDVLGSIGGLFGSCFLMGNMIAWSMLGWILAGFGWRAVFLIPLLPLISIALLFHLCVREDPRSHKVINKMDTPRLKFRLLSILSSKRLVTIAIAYTLLQFVRSGFTLWAPSYLFETYTLPLDVASYMASIIPLGGIIGSIISGWLSDRIRKFGRTLVMFILLLFLSLIIFTFYNAGFHGLHVRVILLFLSGFALYGPHVIMVTVVPMEQRESYGVAGVAGFIDGIGYIGLMFADPFIGWIVDAQGWNGVVTFWLTSSLAAALLIFTLCYAEIKGNIHTRS